MTDSSGKIREFYDVLFKSYGPQNWWPAESKLECILGTILTQNTSWDNASRAISKLKSNISLTVCNLDSLSYERLSELIRPAGYFNIKAKRIKSFIHFLKANYSGNIDLMFKTETSELRGKLLEVKGIGPETADSMLLYAGNKPVFVVDSYTHRIFSRHMLIPEDAGYGEIQERFTMSLHENAAVFNEYHALIVALAKRHCRKMPQCEGCPLEYDLTEKGLR